MPDSTGTLERIAIELARALMRVPAGLRGQGLPDTLSTLGIGFPGAIPGGVVSAGDAAATAADAVPGVLQTLIDAITADNEATIVSSAIELIARAGQITQAFVTFGNAVSAAGVPVPADFDSRLLELFVLDQLDVIPAVPNTLTLLGVIDETDHAGTPGDPTKPAYRERRIRWGRALDLFSDPMTHFGTLYDWGQPGFTGDKLLPAVRDFIARMGLPTVLHPAGGGKPMLLEAFAFDLSPNTSNPPGIDVGVMFPVGGDVDVTIPMPHPAWTTHVKFGGQVSVGATATITPPLAIDVHSPAAKLDGEVKLELDGAPATPFVLFGQAGKSRLEVGGVEIGLGATFAWDSGTNRATFDPELDGHLHGGKLIIDNSEGDGFLSTLLSGLKVEAGFDLGFAWSASAGMRFEGAGSLVIKVPTHIDLGPIGIDGVYLGVGFKDSKVPIELSAALHASLGPLQASVDRLGVEADLSFPAHGGNLGPVQLDINFKPPNGVGLAIDAGIVKGGGYLYFDPDQGEYAGVAELSIAEIVTVKAIGLITTKMPDGSDGFSLLVIISTEFTPIQLGFGFTLNGVGGLLGLNRAVLLDVLRDGVRTGAVDSIMFPTDVVANAPRIISDLKAVFPPKEGTFLVGPMAKFGWGTPSLVTLSLGIVVEIPPGNIAILGVLKIALPDEDTALILVQINFVGTLDFDEQLLAFDASLYDSHVLFIGLEGDMIVRFKWGDNAGFLVSIGGFHPAFTPPSGLSLPATIKRLTISILDYDWAKIRLECYFAVSSNSVQFGAHLYLFFGFDAANIQGELGFDVLFQFSPFYFNAMITGSLSISVFGLDLLSIYLRFSLEGPTPWRAKGTGSISILFFSFSADFDVTWGDSKDTSLPPVDVMPIIVAELQKQDSWKALPPPSSSLLVSLRQLDPSLLVLHPFGALSVAQRKMPLGLTLDKLGNQAPDDVNRVDITAAVSDGASLALGDETEQFAIAQFQTMSDDQKLSRPSYQPLKGGVVVGTAEAMQTSEMTRRTIAYEVSIVDHEPQPLAFPMRAIGGLFHPFLAGAAVARSPLSYQQRSLLQPFSDKIVVGLGSFTVANADNNTAHDASSTFASEAMATQYMNDRIAANPALAGALHVLPAHEVNAA